MGWYPCCCRTSGSCDYCSGSTPNELEVQIIGPITGGAYSGTECADEFVGTWPGVNVGLACDWVLFTFIDDPCNSPTVTVGFHIHAKLLLIGGDYVLRVWLHYFDSAPFQADRGVFYEKNFGTTKPDCSSWNELDVPYVSGPAGCCDFSGSSLKVTAK